MKTVAALLLALLLTAPDCLQSHETVPAGTIVPCQLENPHIKGHWIHWQALALQDVVYHNRTILRKGHLVTTIATRKELPPSINGGKLLTARRGKQIRVTDTGFTTGQIISILFPTDTLL